MQTANVLRLTAAMLTLSLAAAAQCENPGGGSPPPPPPPPPGPPNAPPSGGPSAAPGSGAPSQPAGPVSSPSSPSPGPRSGPARRPGGPVSRPKAERPASPRRASVPDDANEWSVWWELNQDRFLDLRKSLAQDAFTGDDDFNLGQGQRNTKSLGLSSALVQAEVLPRLLEQLDPKSRPSADLLSAGLLGVARIQAAQPSESVSCDLFFEHLQDANPQVREAALLALGLCGDVRNAFVLCDFVDDRKRARELCGSSRVPDRLRAFAAYGLGFLSENTDKAEVRRYCTSRLLQTLQSDDGEQSDLGTACLYALCQSGLDSTKVANGAGQTSAAKKSNEQQPTQALTGQVQWLCDALEDEHFPDRVMPHAAASLGRLLSQLSPSQAGTLEVRRHGMELLGKLLAPRSKADRELQVAAAMALGRVTNSSSEKVDRAARGHLVKAVKKSGDALLRHQAMLALAECASRSGAISDDLKVDQDLPGLKEVRKILLSELSRGKSGTRPWAALALGVLEHGLLERGEQASKDSLLALRMSFEKARSPREVGAMGLALGLCRDAQAAELLVERYVDVSDEGVRGYLALALGMTRAAGHLEQLESWTEQAMTRAELLRELVRARGLLGDKRLASQLSTALKNADSFQRRSALAQAMEPVADRRSLDSLLGLLDSDGVQPTTRALAVLALARMCEQKDMPLDAHLASSCPWRAAPPSLTSAEAGGVLDIL